jgi:Rrf2 family protein
MRYGTRALVEIAAASPQQTLSLKDVARKQQVSVKYLEQIISSLKAAGLVNAVRGPGGGYELTKPPDAIGLDEVYEALEGSAAPVHCVDDPASCAMREVCPTRETWVEVREAIEEVLRKTTLDDLLERRRRKAASASPMYYI